MCNHTYANWRPRIRFFSLLRCQCLHSTKLITLSDEDESASDEVDSRTFAVGEVVWGAHGNFPSWPGKLIGTSPEKETVKVCWFGTKEESEVSPLELKSLSDGLEAHHKERSKLRK